MRNLNLKIDLIPATLKDYPVIQNMARFYVYDLSRECGINSGDWAIAEDGLYDSFDFKIYLDDPARKAFVVRVKNELAGFVLLNKVCISSKSDWNMGEFFILARFQGKGIGKEVAQLVWRSHPGSWEVSVIPENKSAYMFWRKTISNFTYNKYLEETKLIDYDKHQPNRILFSFNSNHQ